MDRKIKLIWDFRGPGATQTAKHHVIHLNEYVAIEKIDAPKAESISVSEFSATAILIVEEKDVPKLRSALKPHRGQLAE